MPHPLHTYGLELAEVSLEPVGVAIVAGGVIDSSTVADLRNALDPDLPDPLVIDLSPVDYMDAVAVAALVAAAFRRGRLIVVAPRNSFARLMLAIAGPPACLRVVDTRDDALAAIRSRRFARANLDADCK